VASVPILACVGYNGMGKSAFAARIAMEHAQAGRTVLGTARLVDWNNPRKCEDAGCTWPSHGEPGHLAAHPMWRPLTDYRDLFTVRDAHVWLDEATGVADARGSQSMPSEVADFIPRLRAKNVTLCWTTIHWSFADVRLRRVTWAAVWAVGLMPQYQGSELWARNRLFYFRAYDAKNLPDDFDLSKRNAKGQSEGLRAMVRGWVWGPRWDAFRAYDTLDGVATLAGTDGTGMCLDCGGHRGRKVCKGHGAEVERVPSPRRRARAEAVELLGGPARGGSSAGGEGRDTPNDVPVLVDGAS
jgi:hypothetical protein